MSFFGRLKTSLLRRALPAPGHWDRTPPGSQPHSGDERGVLSVRLCHEGPRQDLQGRPRGPEGHLAVLPAGGKDRRLGPERRRQVDPAQDHGRARRRLRRRGLGRQGRERRLPAAGAGARPGEGRRRQRHGGHGRNQGPAGPLRSGQRALRRGVDARGNGCPDRRAGRASGADRRRRCLGPGADGRNRHGCPALSAGRCGGRHALGRRAAPGRPGPAAAAEAGPAAAGRADQPPGRRIGGLAGAAPAGLSGHSGGRNPRPLLPGPRRRLDPGARPWQGLPLRGQLLRLARAEAEAPGPGRQGRGGPAADAVARAGVDPAESAGPPGQVQSAPLGLREAPGRGRRGGPGTWPHRDSAGAAPRRPGDRGRGPR